LLDFNASPIRENKLQLAAVPKKQSSRIRCAEKILTQLEYDTLKTNTVDIQDHVNIDVCDKQRIGKVVAVKQSKSVTFKDC